MRILSKKKSTIKNQTRLVCEQCGATIRHTLHGSYSLTTVAKDKKKKSIQQLNGENADEAEEQFTIPNFNIDLSKKNVALNFDMNNEDEIGYGDQTARL